MQVTRVGEHALEPVQKRMVRRLSHPIRFDNHDCVVGTIRVVCGVFASFERGSITKANNKNRTGKAASYQK